MGVKIRKINIVVDSNGFFIKPTRLDITKEKILEYVKDHPMPEDPKYSLEDLIEDLAEQDSDHKNYVLPDIKEETQRFIEELIDKLRGGRNYNIWKI